MDYVSYAVCCANGASDTKSCLVKQIGTFANSLILNIDGV